MNKKAILFLLIINSVTLVLLILMQMRNNKNEHLLADLLISSGGHLVAVDLLMSRGEYPDSLKKLLAEYGGDVMEKYKNNKSIISNKIPDDQMHSFEVMKARLYKIALYNK